MSALAGLDRGTLETAVAEADVRVLLMVLVHLTGDEKWLCPPFQPRRDVRLIPDPGAGLPEAVQGQIRDAFLQAALSDNPPALRDPGDELMVRMMRVCLGEVVAPEYAPLTREEMGLISRHPAWSEPAPKPSDLAQRSVLIVGAGVCGLAMGVSLKRLGIPFTIVDASTDLGGAWNRNRYPGCGVDTPNHSYSYSFGRRHAWSRYFSRREEVQFYLSRIADEFELRAHTRFATRLIATHWDAASRHWVSVLESDGERRRHVSAFLVTAIGQLSDPSVPRIAGQENFRGPIFHSANWPDVIDVAGKRIAVIGTGATSMQLVPTIADRVDSVAIYQRTPQWARPIPGYSDLIGQGAQFLLKHAPFYAEWFRFNMFWRYGDGLLPFLKKDPGWQEPTRSVNRVNDRHRQEMIDFISSELAGREDLIAKCIPTYPPYGKRILLDNGWYKTLRKPNVDLVDTPIDRITADGIVTADGKHRAADIIVYATGFKLSEMAARLDIIGDNGRALCDAWANDNPTAYLGLTVPGFPNYFCMLGPGSGPAHGGSVVFQAECQTRYIAAALVQMVEQRIDVIDVRQEVHDRFITRLDAEHETLIWTHRGMSTYYRNAHGRVISAMPWRFVDYWSMTHDPDFADYRIVKRDATSELPTAGLEDRDMLDNRNDAEDVP